MLFSTFQSLGARLSNDMKDIGQAVVDAYQDEDCAGDSSGPEFYQAESLRASFHIFSRLTVRV